MRCFHTEIGIPSNNFSLTQTLSLLLTDTNLTHLTPITNTDKNNFKDILFQILGTACVTTYYCSLIALSIYYLVVSCYPVLPWTVCHQHLQADSDVICIPSGANMSQFVHCYHPNETSFNQTLCVPASTELGMSPENFQNCI